MNRGNYGIGNKRTNETVVKMMLANGDIKKSIEYAEKCNITPKRYEKLIKETEEFLGREIKC